MVKSEQEVMSFLASIPNINYGGCLVAAYSYYLHEKKAGRADNIQIIALTPNEHDEYVQHNIKYLNNSADRATSSHHFGWSYDGGKTVYDCNGLFTELDYKLAIPKEITDEFCISALNNFVKEGTANRRNWNHMFNRTRNVPYIARYLEIDLSKIQLEFPSLT